jgi:hypothetical protein
MHGAGQPLGRVAVWVIPPHLGPLSGGDGYGEPGI